MWSASLGLDIKLAIRHLRRSPAFVVGSVATLALALGVTSATVRVWRAVEPSSSDVPGGAQVYAVGPVVEGTVRLERGLDVQKIVELRNRLQGGATISGVTRMRVLLRVRDASRIRFVEVVDADYFNLFDRPIARGRPLSAADRGASAIVLSQRLARQLIPDLESAIGSVVSVAQQPYVVVGIADPRFLGLTAPSLIGADAWVIDRPATLAAQGGPRPVMAYLRPYLSGELTGLLSPLDAAGVGIRDLREGLMPTGLVFATRAAGSGITVVTLAMLLVAMMSLSALLVSRALSSRVTVDTRLALGATKGLAFRPFFIEGVLVLLLGVACAVPFGQWLMLQLATMTAGESVSVRPYLPVDRAIDIVTPALGFATSLLLLVIVRRSCFGRADAASGQDRVLAVRGGGRGSRTARLIGIQVAVSMMLLSATAVVARSIQTSASNGGWLAGDLPFLARVDFRLTGLDPAGRNDWTRRLVDIDLSGIGVYKSAVSSGVPIGRDGIFLRVPGKGNVRFLSVESDFFDLYSIPIQGAGLAGHGDQRVVVVSRSVADWVWPDSRAVGQDLLLQLGGRPVAHRVVGVADTVELAGATAEQSRQVYVPLSNDAPDRLVLSMRTKGSQIGPEQLQDALSEHLPGVPFEDVVSVKTELLKDAMALRVAAQLTLIGAAFSMAITLVAVYCVARVEFESRLRDIGVMVAIGAEVRHVGLLIGRPFQRALLVGLLGGGTLCALAVAALGDLLQLRSGDLLPMLGVSALGLSLVLGAAVALPVVRLRRISPALLLRNP